MGSVFLAILLILLGAALLMLGLAGVRPLLTALGAIVIATAAIYGVRGSIPLPSGHDHHETGGR